MPPKKKKPAADAPVEEPARNGRNHQNPVVRFFLRHTMLSGALLAVLTAVAYVAYQHDPAAFPPPSEKPPEREPFDRIPATELTTELFLTVYANKRPVVITGAWNTSGWQPQELAASCPHAWLRANAYRPGAGTWAGHVTVKDMKVQDYVATYLAEDKATRPKEILYGFEFKLGQQCPQMLEKFKMPGYLAQDAFHLATNNTGIGWPSAFLGPMGAESGLHIDTHRTPFWVAHNGPPGVPLKRWHVWPHDNMALLKFGAPTKTTNFRFDFNTWAPDKRLDGHKVFDGELFSGDILYAPGGAPHAAKNLEDNTAVSINYMDLKTMPDFVRKCTQGSPLCGLVQGKGAWIIDALQERQKRREPMTYWEFVNVADKKGFCEVHKHTMMDDKTRPPALEEYCAFA